MIEIPRKRKRDSSNFNLEYTEIKLTANFFMGKL